LNILGSCGANPLDCIQDLLSQIQQLLWLSLFSPFVDFCYFSATFQKLFNCFGFLVILKQAAFASLEQAVGYDLRPIRSRFANKAISH